MCHSVPHLQLAKGSPAIRSALTARSGTSSVTTADTTRPQTAALLFSEYICLVSLLSYLHPHSLLSEGLRCIRPDGADPHFPRCMPANPHPESMQANQLLRLCHRPL